MTFVYVAAIGVLLVVAIHLAVGWSLANGLYEGMLRVYPRERVGTVRVRALSGDRLVLEAPAPTQEIGHPGRLGIVWEGGHGTVGDVLTADGLTVTRSFNADVGTPPVCEGPIEGCPAVLLEGYYYRHGPGDVGLKFEETTYKTELGEMAAWAVPAGDGSKWAVLCHGWTAERRELVRMLPELHRRGWSALVIAYRNDPGMPADPTGRYRFGVSEWRDVESAVTDVQTRGASEVILVGCSTGGALVMSFLERSELADAVRGVVLDSPNLVLSETVRLATAGSKATRLMIEVGMWIADLRWRIDWEATDHVARAAECLQVPALVFHGTSDQTVPIVESRALEALVPSLVELVETPAAGHVMSWNADPGRYEAYLGNFLDRI